MKLKVKDIKEVLRPLKTFCTVFKSGSNIILRIDNAVYEDCIKGLLRDEGLQCVPERVPTDGYYRLIRIYEE